MMFAVPTAIAVTAPVDDTAATAVLLELQETARPVSVPPFASSIVAVACEVPIAVIVVGLSETVTEATGTGVTVIKAVPPFPSLVAVMTAVPTPTAVTRPVALTVAAAELLDHVTMRPPSGVPPASLVVATNCCVALTGRVTDAGLIATVATGTVTVIEAVPVFASLVAVIVVLPPPTAVTNPLASTVATDGTLDVHVTERPVRTLPLPSFVTAVSCCVEVTPRSRLADEGLTVTVAT